MGRAIQVDKDIDDLKIRVSNLEKILNDLNKPNTEKETEEE